MTRSESTVETNTNRRPRLLFVTGRLAEFALRQVLEELAPRAGFVAEIAVLPISVAALMTPAWVARRLEIPAGVDRLILPGHCRGDLGPIVQKTHGVPVELGPEDLRDLPGHFGQATAQNQGYGVYDIEILAEINHAPQLRARPSSARPSNSSAKEPTSLTWAATPEQAGAVSAMP